MYTMNSEGGMNIEKLNKTTYYVWKHSIELVLTYLKAVEVVDKENPHAKESKEYIERNQRDKLACPLIGLSLSDEILESLRNCKTTKQILSNINNIFRRCNLLDKM